MARTRETEAKIRRAIVAWRKCGLEIGSVEIAPDGTVRILAPSEAPGVSSPDERDERQCDAVFGGAR